MGGYWDTGSAKIATKPSSMMSSAMTLASTGRSMKNLAIMRVLGCAGGLIGRRCQRPLGRGHKVAGYGVLQPVDDDLAVGIEAAEHGAIAVLERTRLDTLLPHLLVGTHGEQVAADLVAAHHAVRHHQARRRRSERDA